MRGMLHGHNHPEKFRHDLAFIFIFAFAIRFGYMAYMLGQVDVSAILTLTPDSIRYVNIGAYLAGYGPADEGAVLIFGPGYGIFLGLIFYIFGVGGLPVLLFQTLLSAFTCLIIYRLSYELIENKTIGYIAAIFLSLSFTSVSLANIILSDTLFLALFAWGNLVFILGLRNRRLSYFVLSGIIITAAIATRTMAQFWPLIMLAMIFFLPGKNLPGQLQQSRLGILKKAWIAPAIAILITAMWVGRNYSKHDLPATSLAGSHGLGRLSATTLTLVEKRDRVEVWDSLVTEYKQRIGRRDLSAADQNDLMLDMAKNVFGRYPVWMIKTYFGLMWKNASAVNDLYIFQFPSDSIGITEFFKEYRPAWANYITLFLTLSGLLLMALKKQWRLFVFLGLIYLYLLAMLGFGQWQGSRLFFPGLIVSSITIGYLIITVIQSMRIRFAR